MAVSKKQFRQWLRERDAMVEKQDVEEFKRFFQKWRARGFYDRPLPADERVVEASLRYMALSCENITMETKLAATLWLLSRGFHLPEGEKENGQQDKQGGASAEQEAPGAEDGGGADDREAGGGGRL